MKKVRLESLEHLMKTMREDEVVKLAFDLIDQSCAQLDWLGIEKPDVVILCGREYTRPSKSEELLL